MLERSYSNLYEFLKSWAIFWILETTRHATVKSAYRQHLLNEGYPTVQLAPNFVHRASRNRLRKVLTNPTCKVTFLQDRRQLGHPHLGRHLLAHQASYGGLQGPCACIGASVLTVTSQRGRRCADIFEASGLKEKTGSGLQHDRLECSFIEASAREF